MVKQLIEKVAPKFLISWYHFVLTFFGALVYGFPSRKLKVIGITGTNGKTTTVTLTHQILESAGCKTASTSSIAFRIGQKEEENKLKMTMPGHGVLQKFLRDAVRAGCEYAIIEATSEGVLQHRHRFINWQIMVFTNLSPEHIERHGSFENYKKAKGEYFNICKGTHIVNVDDENADYFLQFPARQKYHFSMFANPITKHWVKAENVIAGAKGLSFEVEGLHFQLNLMGRFNVYNALAAVAIGLSQGLSLEQCRKALEKVKAVPGRMEEIISHPFRVIVDYAVTPDALEQAYQIFSRQSRLTTQSLNHLTTHLICVLGACGGGRDKWKRPELGKIARKYCQEIIITNEDPYDENPMEIIEQVASSAGDKAVKILDRREAIRKALELARPGDMVIITGKGAENSMAVKAGKKIPWDDRQVVREEFAKLKKNNDF